MKFTGLSFPGSTRLNPALVLGQNVSTYAVAPDSSSAIYRANQDNVSHHELYRRYVFVSWFKYQTEQPARCWRGCCQFYRKVTQKLIGHWLSCRLPSRGLDSPLPAS